MTLFVNTYIKTNLISKLYIYLKQPSYICQYRKTQREKDQSMI
jgi:hypothetical protein